MFGDFELNISCMAYNGRQTVVVEIKVVFLTSGRKLQMDNWYSAMDVVVTSKGLCTEECHGSCPRRF